MKTGQEEFWQGEFGTEYIYRNKSGQLLAANTSFFSKVLKRTGKLASVLELGCNVGMNLRALRGLLPECSLFLEPDFEKDLPGKRRPFLLLVLCG